MRFCRRKSTSGSPTCTARKPNTSSTALSNWASSQSSTYAPWGVESHPESDERPPLYFSAPFWTKARCMREVANLDVVPVPAFKDNYVWTLRNATHAAVVDPGEARPVLDYLARENLYLAAILATHHHPDHVGGIAQILEKFRVPVYGPRNEPIATLTRPVSEGDTVTLPQLGVSLSVLDIPGQARCSAATRCSRAAAGGCSRGRRSRCTRRSRSCARCPTIRRCTAATSTRSRTSGSRKGSSRATPRSPRARAATAPCAPPASPPCRARCARRRPPTRSCAAPSRRSSSRS